ncbi:unnamed protein product [Urochloa humidicola]
MRRNEAMERYADTSARQPLRCPPATAPPRRHWNWGPQGLVASCAIVTRSSPSAPSTASAGINFSRVEHATTLNKIGDPFHQTVKTSLASITTSQLEDRQSV